jgi:diguanylate cyclase (GGDEF)-like protein
VHRSRLRPPGKDAASSASACERVAGTLKAGNARWGLIAVPVPGGPLMARHDRTWIVLGASLLLSLILTLYMRSSLRQSRELQLANQEITVLAQRDALTGLANRRAFNVELAAAFSAGRRGGPAFAVLYFDLDHFKDINDTLGHPVGDRLLKQVAERIQDLIRRDDVAARFGGDEFAILQRDTDVAATATMAGRLNEALAAPYVIDGNVVHITVSIGIVLDTPAITTPDALVIQADLALYRAKQDGRSCYRFHTPELDREVYERVTTTEELRSAIGRGELRLHYQPQVELKSGRIVGVEGLLRWQHPTRGLLGPAQFIAIAERTGTITALGEWAFEEACRQMKAWSDQGIDPDLIAVNFSASQFKIGSSLDQFLAGTLNKWRVEPSAVEIELTESVLMEVTKEHSDSLERLRQLGVRIAIDDFGTGYSSLSYLTNYPVNRLKIAQELVFGVIKDRRNATVVRTAIRLAGELGIECIAEGVETAEQAKFLVAAGCAYGQGYLFDKPLSAERMTTRLRAARRKRPRLELAVG